MRCCYTPAPASIHLMTDIEIYAECIARVRHHLSIVDTVLAGSINTGYADLNAELIFIHFRKGLEELAFSSLSANREKYSQARAGFATEWNARRMLGFVHKVNPNFYPVPLKEPIEQSPGRKHFDLVKEGYLTREDFEVLYDGSAEVLHAPNPYAPGEYNINVKYPADEWSRRIKALLSWHFVQLVDVPGIWLIQVPNAGPVRAFPAMADGGYVFDPSRA